MNIETNVIPFGRGQALDPETNVILGKAFDAAWDTLHVSDKAKADELRDALAKRIIAMGQSGKRDVVWLRDDALAHLKQN
jgi:hypothetical protein